MRLVEIGTELAQGQLLGEIGFFAPGHKRTLTAECSACQLHRIGASNFRQLYYQNPEFGFYIVQPARVVPVGGHRAAAERGLTAAAQAGLRAGAAC